MSEGVERNTAELLVDGHEILPALLDDMRAARRSLHVSVFLWFRDPIGEELADLLIRKAQQGVACRVLLNVDKTGMGDPFSTGEKEMMAHDPSVTHDPLDVEPMCQRLTDAGVEVLNSNIDYDNVIDGGDPRLVSVAAQIRDTIAIDELHIDHRKIVLIDDRIAYCGGANIGAQYLYHVPFDPALEARQEGEQRKQAALPEPWWKWHDSWTRFEGPIAHELEAYFHDRFVLDGGKIPHALVTDSCSSLRSCSEQHYEVTEAARRPRASRARTHLWMSSGGSDAELKVEMVGSMRGAGNGHERAVAGSLLD